MVKRPAIILLVILALVIGGYFLIKNRSNEANEAQPTATPASMLIQENEHGNLTLLEIKDNTTSTTLQLKRFSDGNWTIVAPYEGAADQGKVTAAETQLFALKIMSSLETAADFSVLGLSTPGYIISLTFVDGAEETIQVGVVTPTGSGYYVQRNGKVYVISTYSIDAILGLLDNPPYLATQTPAAESTTSTPTQTP